MFNAFISIGPPGADSDPPTRIINVVIESICFGAQIPPIPCEPFPLPSPLDFTMQVLAGNPTEPFQGSSDGTSIAIEIGGYEVIVLDAPNTHVSGSIRFSDIDFSEDCIGSIESGETKICTILNTYEIGSFSEQEPKDARPNLNP